MKTAEAGSSPEVPAAPPGAAPRPFCLKPKCRIQLGYRIGTVVALRGGGKEPYEVLVRWDNEKYPQFLTFRTLELEYEKGTLKLI